MYPQKSHSSLENVSHLPNKNVQNLSHFYTKRTAVFLAYSQANKVSNLKII
jgi:hypothetical protein